jgi:hypothetical protein
MKTVPGAIINLEKWTGDIEPISKMEEAWFRIKGIPMKFRSKSTAYYVASLVGKPLGLDKNYLRNFSYVRVKIGCQDLSLVPSSRIGEIKNDFYEFQYTRELFEPTPSSGNRAGVNETITNEGGNQGTPKRQRTAGNGSETGSQSAPPMVSTGPPAGSHRQAHIAPQGRQFSVAEKGKRKVRDDCSSEERCGDQSNTQTVLTEL